MPCQAGSKERQKDLKTVVSVGQTVRCATVDNFQGEEAKVIILSLTRNNSQGNIGEVFMFYISPSIRRFIYPVPMHLQAHKQSDE